MIVTQSQPMAVFPQEKKWLLSPLIILMQAETQDLAWSLQILFLSMCMYYHECHEITEVQYVGWI